MLGRSKRAFTLVEILVVCAIIAILGGIASVATVRAVRSSKETSCIANLKQLEHAWALYEGDHDQWSPPLPISSTPSLSGPAAFVAGLKPYGANGEVLFCPLDSWAKTAHMGEWHTHEYLSYTVSLDLVVHSSPIFNDLIKINRSVVGDPSGVILLTDQPELRNNEDGTRVRLSAHGAKANAVYVDGHAKSYMLPPP